jgi:membrane fusion protein (multidrug efflux system)
LVVPEEAIVPQGGRATVVKVSPGADKDEIVSERVTVKIGLRQPGKVEILEGLFFGDTVVVAGQQRLQKDGTLLKIVEPAKAQGSGGNKPAENAAGKSGDKATDKAGNANKPKGKDMANNASAGENPCLRGLNATR